MRELERDLPTQTAAASSGEALPSLVVVGAGRMGGALARSASEVGVTVALAGRDDALAACRQAEAALLCVPDDEIATAAAIVSEAIPPLRLVGHTSGASGLDALRATRERGAATFSVHPLQSVPDSGTDLAGAPCAVSGSEPEAEHFAALFAERLGMRPFLIPEHRRAAYHAAASIASNFLVTLEESAAELLRRAGVDDARELLAPLVLRTAANWAESGAEALTGPIARGDVATVRRQAEALRELAPELAPMYEALAERTQELARSEGGR